MVFLMSQILSISHASDDIFSCKSTSPSSHFSVLTRTLQKEHFVEIATHWKMSVTYVEGVYQTLIEKKFMRADTLGALKQKKLQNNPRGNFMRYKLVDRLMSDHMMAFGQRVMRRHIVQGAGSIQSPEFVGIDSMELKRLSANTAYDQGVFSVCDEALRDANFNYRRALDISIKRSPHPSAFEDYRQLATQADECINLLFSFYAQKASLSM